MRMPTAVHCSAGIRTIPKCWGISRPHIRNTHIAYAHLKHSHSRSEHTNLCRTRTFAVVAGAAMWLHRPPPTHSLLPVKPKTRAFRNLMGGRARSLMSNTYAGGNSRVQSAKYSRRGSHYSSVWRAEKRLTFQRARARALRSNMGKH